MGVSQDTYESQCVISESDLDRSSSSVHPWGHAAETTIQRGYIGYMIALRYKVGMCEPWLLH